MPLMMDMVMVVVVMRPAKQTSKNKIELDSLVNMHKRTGCSTLVWCLTTGLAGGSCCTGTEDTCSTNILINYCHHLAVFLSKIISLIRHRSAETVLLLYLMTCWTPNRNNWTCLLHLMPWQLTMPHWLQFSVALVELCLTDTCGTW